MKTALIFGANGQDGSYMTELLLEKGYTVHGTIRRCSVITTERIDHIFDSITLHYSDVTDCMNVFNLISKIKPDEIYNFSAQSHVKISAELESYTFNVNTIGVLNILSSVLNAGLAKTCKVYQASTSEIMGNQTDGTFKMNEETRQSPVSIYGISKYAAQQICNMYRDVHGMFVVNSILYNHESPRRGHNFLTQKVATYVGKFSTSDAPLVLGNLNSQRDWGHARDYVEAVYLMLQQTTPQNYVISTGETHSVREFVELAFKRIGITINWEGDGLEEVGVDQTGKIRVKVDPKYYRDIEIDCLLGDSSKAHQLLGWKPKVLFNDLVNEMVDSKTPSDSFSYKSWSTLTKK